MVIGLLGLLTATLVAVSAEEPQFIGLDQVDHVTVARNAVYDHISGMAADYRDLNGSYCKVQILSCGKIQDSEVLNAWVDKAGVTHYDYYGVYTAQVAFDYAFNGDLYSCVLPYTIAIKANSTDGHTWTYDLINVNGPGIMDLSFICLSSTLN